MLRPNAVFGGGLPRGSCPTMAVGSCSPVPFSTALEPEDPRLRRNEWLALLALSLTWGWAFPLTGYLLRTLPYLWIAYLRIAIGGIALAAIVLLLDRDLRPTLRAWRRLLAMGLFNNAIPFTLTAWGQSRIDSGLAAIINASTPIWAALIGAAIGAVEGLTARRWAGVALGFFGVAILVGPGDRKSTRLNSSHRL